MVIIIARSPDCIEFTKKRRLNQQGFDVILFTHNETNKLMSFPSIKDN